MKDISQATALVYDHGSYFPVAQRLAQDFQKVYYFTEWETGLSQVGNAVLGDGFENVIRVRDPWKVKREVDLFVFPDIGQSGMQEELESQGIAVWGARSADQQEQNRELFLKTLGDCGLKVPPHTVVVGLTNLREYLAGKEDQYIKISRYRGSFETSHFRSLEDDRSLLDWWGVKFGPVAELVRFIVFPNIDTPLEIGADTFCVDGQWPDVMLHGLEWKDKSYFSAVTKREDMPQQIQDVLDRYSAVLERSCYRSQFSMEVRVKEDTGYFIDPTCRGGLPSTNSFLRMKNASQVIYHGAHGELVQPDYGYAFAAESIVNLKGEGNRWRTCREPEGHMKEHLFLTGCCNVNGVLAFPPNEHDGGDVGWLVNTGDDQEEVITGMNALADELPDGLDASTETLGYVLKEIHDAGKEGIEFSDEPTPEPAVVMED